MINAFFYLNVIVTFIININITNNILTIAYDLST